MDIGSKYDKDGIEIHFLNKKMYDTKVKVKWIAVPRVNRLVQVHTEFKRSEGPPASSWCAR